VGTFLYLAAFVPLNHLGHYIHWGWFYLSVANFIVICLMVATFVAALLLPFPGRRSRKESR
jgi:multidrug efflux pump subunit AcrB